SKPSSICFARSAVPTTSAPACSASRAFSPSAKTATRDSRPVPCGSINVPRSCWSAWRTFRPSRKCASTVSSNVGPAQSLSSRIASLIRTAAGGVFVMDVNERSSKTVISTGVIRPFSCAVCALKALQNSMMLTPCWPSAGPTGGAGLACPPGIWSLMRVRIFFATARVLVELLYLIERELNRDLALEDVHEHLELLLVGVDVDDLAVEV